MEIVGAVYLICFFVGVGFVFLSFLLSGVFGGGMEHGDVGVDPGVDGTGGHDMHFSPLSPIVISFFLAAFGGTGIIVKEYFAEIPWGVQVPIALATAVLFAGAVGTVYYRIVAALQSTSLARVEDFVGMEAEVTVSIPARGVGQVAFTFGGRHIAPARSVDESEIPARSLVKIARIVGPTYYVERVP